MLKRTLTALAILVASLGLQPPAAGATPEPIHHWSEAPAEVQAQHSPEAIQSFIDAYWRNVWVDAYWARVVAYTKGVEAAHSTYQPGQCGGSLPPCWVMMHESRGDIRIWNGQCHAPYGYAGRRSPCPRGTSTASGKWQITRPSWGRHRGYLNAADAPESVQDERARIMWDGGRGCSHWSAC